MKSNSKKKNRKMITLMSLNLNNKMKDDEDEYGSEEKDVTIRKTGQDIVNSSFSSRGYMTTLRM